MHTRMLAASMDNDSYDEEEGDSIFKERYDRLRRESEMNKQQLKREHAEELEQAESSKKHAERKVLVLQRGVFVNVLIGCVLSVAGRVYPRS